MYGVLNSTYCMPCNDYDSHCEVCYQQNVSHCMQCYNAYGADNGLCKLCTLNCETCKTTDWNYCLTCVYNNTLHRYNISGNVYAVKRIFLRHTILLKWLFKNVHNYFTAIWLIIQIFILEGHLNLSFHIKNSLSILIYKINNYWHNTRSILFA